MPLLAEGSCRSLSLATAIDYKRTRHRFFTGAIHVSEAETDVTGVIILAAQQPNQRVHALVDFRKSRFRLCVLAHKVACEASMNECGRHLDHNIDKRQKGNAPHLSLTQHRRRAGSQAPQLPRNQRQIIPREVQLA